MSSKLITTCAQCTTKCTAEHPTKSKHLFRTHELSKFKERVNTFYSSDEELWQEQIDPFNRKLEEMVSELLGIREDFERDCLNRRLENAFQSEKGSDKELIDAARAAVQGEYTALTCRDVAKIEQKIELHRRVAPKEISKICSQLVERAEQRLAAIFNKTFELNKKPTTSTRKVQRVQETPKYEKEREKTPKARESVRIPTQESNVSDQSGKRKNEWPTLKIRQIPQISSHFNILLKVISVDKEFYLDRERKVQFQAGDETGTATVVTKALKFIKEGTVLTLFNARVYNFHGSKQIQMGLEDAYIIEQTSKNVVINDDFNLSGQPRKGGNRNRGRKDNRADRTDRNQDQRPARDERQYRETRPRAEQRQPRREERPYVRERDQEMHRQRERERREREQQRERKRQEQQKERERQRQQERKRQEEARLRAKQRESNQYQRNNRKAPEQPAPERDRAKYEQDAAQKNPAHSNLIKIKDIDPGEEDLSFIGEIFELRPREKTTDIGNMFCVLGDETAIVQAQLPRYSGEVKQNTVVLLSKVESKVINGHIRICLAANSSIERTKMRIPRINTDKNISADEYEEQEEGSEDSEQEEEDEDDEEDKKIKVDVEDF